MALQWKWIAASRTGTSHQRRGEECQDFSRVLVVPRGEETFLVAVCADGAGSASHSALGARLACDTLIQCLAEFANAGGFTKDINRSHVETWYDQARRTLIVQSAHDGVSLREYACTLLLVVVDESGASFAQLGDGAIVIGNAGKYRPVFWPQEGEYVNTTWFLTGENFAEYLLFCADVTPPSDVALLTDGLQPLVLHYASRSAHAPFFRSMFDSLRANSTPEDLQTAFESYLDGPAINNRTDDDKTLILATNQSLCHATEPTI